MLIFGRYLLTNYLKVLALAVFSFISILLVSRLEEITHYASMGAKPLYLIRFILYQIPYILPIAIPISCLLSALILFQKLSFNQELTALRAGGFSLKKIISPILIAAFFLSLTSLYISSELATASHLATRKMVYELCSINPLLLLQNAKIGKLQDAYVQMEPVKNGEAIENLIVALHTPSQERMSLCLVKQIGMGSKELKANQISLISSSATRTEHAVDHLIIENQRNRSVS